MAIFHTFHKNAGWCQIGALLAVCLAVLCGSASAAPVTQESVRQVAQNYMSNHISVHGSWNGSSTPEIASVQLVMHNNVPLAYNVTVRPSGHLLVAYDDDFAPVLLYSDNSSFDPDRVDERDSVESWIIPETYAVYQDLQLQQRDYVAYDLESVVRHYKKQTPTAKAWDFFNKPKQDFSPLRRAKKGQKDLTTDSVGGGEAAVGGPLLTTTWNQGSPRTAPYTYNLYTPADSSCTHTYTGCVATATAQLMKYWNWPDSGTGSHSYSWSPPSGAASRTLSASFSHTYNWSSMPASLSATSSSSQIDAVARLMSDVGIANEMDYGCSGSGADTHHSAATVLPTYFKYQDVVQTVERSAYSATAFFAAIKAEIDAVPPRPSLYRMTATSGGGHAIVADGYQTGSTNMVHMNMGWGGSWNGYYDISNNWTTGDSTWTVTSQTVFTNIRPTDTTHGSTCSYTLGSSSQAYGASATSGSVSVAAGSSCAWTASSGASWITITSGTSGTGTGSVAYSLAANSSSSSRNATLTIGGQTFTVTQAGASCSYALATTTASVSASASSATLALTTTSSCAWSAISNVSWLSITSSSSGSGSTSVSYAVAANGSSNARSGTLSIAGQTFTVTQAGAAPTCAYSLSPTSQSLSAGATTGRVSVAAGNACAWTASSAASWLTISSGSSGSGYGTVAYAVAANSSSSSRSGTITIGGQAYTVTQEGAVVSTTSLRNPGFESGASNWVQVSDYGDIITDDYSMSRSGDWFAWLGGYDDAADMLYQDITIPASAHQASIQFWYMIDSSETAIFTAYDKLVVSVENPLTGTKLVSLTKSNLNTTLNWLQSASLDVSAYAGQTVRLKFYATTDSTDFTNFLVDDVTLTTSTSAASGPTTSQVDCLFRWAEAAYPTLLAPANPSSATLSPYYYRYYASTTAYLASSSTDQHLYYLGPLSSGQILDLGLATSWLSSAGCQ